MARGFNKVILMGNLARDPEMRYTVDKRAWARFTVAVNYSWRNRNGETQDETSFVPVVAWGPLGENCGRYLKKGRPVLVEGRLRQYSYEARDGSGTKYDMQVVASDVTFLGSGRQSDEGAPQGRSSYGSSTPAPDAGGFSPPPFPDDGNFGKSISEKGFGDDFLRGFEEMGKNGEEAESDIPF